MLFRVWPLKILVWTILGGDDRKTNTSTAMADTDRRYNLDRFMTLRVFEMSFFFSI